MISGMVAVDGTVHRWYLDWVVGGVFIILLFVALSLEEPGCSILMFLIALSFL